MIRKASVALTVLTLAVSQTGCIVGAALGPFGLPIWATGIGAATFGAILTGAGAIGGNMPVVDTGLSFLVVGTILDQKNPGSVEGYNQLSQDSQVATTLGLTTEEVRHYNANLRSKIPAAAKKLIRDLKEPLQSLGYTLVSNPGYDYLSDAGLEKIAKDYGFDSVSDLIDVVRGNSLPRANQESIARHLGLDLSDARILLAREGIALQ